MARSSGRAALEAGLRQGVLKAKDVAVPLAEEEDDYKSPFAITKNEDGSWDIGDAANDDDDDDIAAPSLGFDENLAETIANPEFLRDLGATLTEEIEYDIQARKERDEQQAEGMKRSGIAEPAPGGADFPGASRATHPVMAEAGIDFAAAAAKELYPPNGPVKTKIEGPTTDKKLQKARRKAMHMNWQLTVQIAEFLTTFRTMLSQLPYGGSQYLLPWFDPNMGRPRIDFVPIDMVYMDYSADSAYTALRLTHRQDIVQSTFDDRVRTGLYRELDLGEAGGLAPIETESSEQAAKVEGKERPIQNQDGQRTVYHCYAKRDLQGHDGRAKPGNRPYIIMLDMDSMQVLGIYRNWEESDPYQNAVDHLIQYDFIPWRGALAIGLPHIVGGLSSALTGALRALMDSALIANQQILAKMKGNKMGGQTKSGAQQNIVELEGKLLTDDIRKLAFQLQTNGPSSTLFSLLGWLDGQARGLVSTAEEKVQDATAQGPVGTTQALIEAGSKVFSSIFAGLHNSQMRLFRALARINRIYMDERVVIQEFGELVVFRADYETPFDVRPVSDPNIFSETQRITQAQGVLQLTVAHPQEMVLRPALEDIMSALHVDNPERYLKPKPPEPKPIDPASENMLMCTGMPVKAYPGQDHLAHLSVLIAFLMSPIFGMNKALAPIFLPAARAHVAEHLALLYLDTMQAVSSMFQDLAPEHAQALSISIVHENLEHALVGIPEIMDMVDQAIKELVPPQPMDPAAAALQAAQQETARRAKKDQLDHAIDQEQIKTDRTKILADLRRNAEDNQTQLEIAEQHDDVALETAAMREETARKTAQTRARQQAKTRSTVH